MLKTCHFMKKRHQHRCFPVNFAKFLGTAFFNRTPPVTASAFSLYLRITFPISWKKNKAALTHYILAIYVLVCILIYAFTFKTICKPWHWDLGVGIGFEIGIETDVVSVIVSTSTRPMDSKLFRVVTQEKKTPPTKPHDTSTTWSCDKSKTSYLHIYEVDGRQNLAGW